MALNTICPSCGTAGMSPFYSVEDVPVHSCIMLANEREAREFPRGRVELGLCGACGFISNMAFDPRVQDYSSLYEDQQCYSPTFNEFASGLVRKLVEKYDLHGKNVLEIGCGKADFLDMVCTAGDNYGVGIDPACDPAALRGSSAERISIIQDYYSERYMHYTGDMVICRHTLEHIYQTREFLENVRAGIGKRRKTVVFLEVPEAGIVLDNLVFWDVYYEHCSYFSPGSLARLFRSCRFDVLDLYTAFDDQYLLIEACPVDEPPRTVHPREESLEEMAGKVEHFSRGVARSKDRWIRTIKDLASAAKKPVIWGSGSKCVSFLTTLGIDQDIECVVDINPRRHGKYIAGVGKRIMPPEHLREVRPGAVIVMNPVYKREIADAVSAMGLAAEILTV